ncbi:hypothetical protein PoB_001291900 [Plakobranchus ocellatus]|uniref:Uncharacterized protein n=1 Tax=Plakobranchus ocellatus TaxID=259542 RepID=A0AAV3YTM4_9GAST|nr:hypothetical protein PoB_001291900 [Plakobranchus ocellatus]
MDRAVHLRPPFYPEVKGVLEAERRTYFSALSSLKHPLLFRYLNSDFSFGALNVSLSRIRNNCLEIAIATASGILSVMRN